MPKSDNVTAKTSFPRPRFHMVRDTTSGQNAIKFFQYWKELPAELHDLIQVWIYRSWPVCDLRLTEPNRKTVTWAIIEGAIPFEPEEYQDEFLHRFGSGDWRCSLNEKGVSGGIMECVFSAVELERFPPKLDLKTVVRGHYRNEDYIRWLRMKNVAVPWEDGDTEGETEMVVGASDALKTVTDATLKMADKNMELTEAAADARIKAAEAESKTPSAEATAVQRSINLVADTADRMVDMVTKHAGQQYDPIEMLKAASDLLGNKGEKDSAGEQWVQTTKLIVESVQSSNDKLFKIQQDNIEFLKVLAARPGPAIVSSEENGGKTQQQVFLERAEEYKRIADLFGWSSRSRTPAPEREPKPTSHWAETLAENIGPISGAVTGVFALIANMVYNFRLRAGEKPQPPAEAMRAVSGESAAPAAVAAQSAAAPAEPKDKAAGWQLLIQQMEAPFLNHFFGERTTGYSLAEFVLSDGTGGQMTQNGRRTYLAIKEQLGAKGFDLLIRGHFPIWSKVQATPQRYAQFLNEFFSYDEWIAQQELGGEPPEPSAAPPSGSLAPVA